MSFRLTNEIRDTICDRVIGTRFENRTSGLVKERKAIAEACYKRQYTKAVRAKMSTLPKGWLQECSQVYVQFGPGRHYLEFNGTDWSGRHNLSAEKKSIEPEYRRFADKDAGRFKLVITADDKLAERFEACTSAQTDLINEQREMETEVLGVLGGVHSSKTLLASWPEVEPFLKGVVIAVKTPLPAIRVADLNKRLGLKTAA